MNPAIEIIIQNRKTVSSLIKSLSISQNNDIPSGFNNNIIWNFAHSIAVHQRLIYGLSGNLFTLPKEFVKEFDRGTKPVRYYTQEDIDVFLEYSKLSTAQWLKDMDEGIFSKWHPYETIIKFEINDLASAIAFNSYHEALHLGYIMNIKRFVLADQ